MIPTYVFIIMAILSALLLLIATIASVIGAVDVFASQAYNQQSADGTVSPSAESARSAHQLLTISAALGASALVTLTIIMLVAGVTGGFSTAHVSDAVLTKGNPSKEDLIAAYKGEKALSSGHVVQIIMIIVLILVTLITVAVGIMAMIAAIKLANILPRDDNINTAYLAAIIAAVAAVGGIGVMIVAVISYFSIRHAKQKQLKETEVFIEETQKKLGVAVEPKPAK